MSQDEEEIRRVRERLKAGREADNIRTEFAELKSEIDNFSDGYTDWKDVVSAVQSDVNDVEYAIGDLESAVRFSGGP